MHPIAEDYAAEIVVDDHWAGIPADERALVLEPFFRRNAARKLKRQRHVDSALNPAPVGNLLG